MKKAYYARPITMFGSILESSDINAIEAAGFEVINKNGFAGDEGYKRYGMEYFKLQVEGSDVVFFRAFPDNTIGAGIVRECMWAFKAAIPVFEIPRQFHKRSLDVDQTREMLKECGRKQNL